MRVITARNVQSALFFGLELFKRTGETKDSRNGQVVVVPGPVTTHYTRPRERVLFWPQRDANPFFHFFESLWMLAGRNDVAFVSQFAKQMAEYSDDGQMMHGAYGYRWRHHFDFEGNSSELPDQLPLIAKRLRDDPNDRRCVLTMWDPISDLNAVSKDLPCNTHIYFSRSINGELDMTVCCRSNDMIWGGYGANAVHFSVLQEFMAAAIGCGVGNYWHISNNYHAYRTIYDPLVQKFRKIQNVIDPYTSLGPSIPLVEAISAEAWLEECANFCEGPDSFKFKAPFFNYVARPLWNAHGAYKNKMYGIALKAANECQAPDWKLAAREWLERRQAAHERAKDDGPTYETK